MKMMRLKVIVRPDAGPSVPRIGPCGFGVFDAETGREIPVVSAEIKADVNHVPILRIETYDFEAEAEGTAVVYRLCPGCQKDMDAELDDADTNPIKSPGA